MPYASVWIHLVWATKKRQPFLPESIRETVFAHIKENAKAKKICIDRFNGYEDHVHCLLSLGVSQEIQTIVHLLKGESSFWINQQNLIAGKFEWQKGYFAVSVSESGVDKVRAYIDGQKEHHRKKAFKQEYEAFMKRYGFENVEGEL